MDKKYLIYGVLGVFLIILFSMVFITPFQITIFNNSLSTENLTFTGNENITRYFEINRYANVTSAVLNLTGYLQADLNLGNGEDGELIFTTTTKSYGNLNTPVDYNVSGETLYLNLNQVYQFTDVIIGIGTTLSSVSSEGAVLYILANNSVNLSGSVILNDVVDEGNRSDKFTGDGQNINAPGVSGINNGFGDAGEGGRTIALYSPDCYGGSGGSGGTPGGSGGASVSRDGSAPYCLNGNSGGTSSGGSGSANRGNNVACSGTATSGKGGDAYGNNGNAGSTSGACSSAGGGGGAGGNAGKSGIHFYVKSENIISTGSINTVGINGGNGGAGGNGACSGGIHAFANGGDGGSGGGGGNGGDIKFYYNKLTDSGSETLSSGTGGTGGTGGIKANCATGEGSDGDSGSAGSSGSVGTFSTFQYYYPTNPYLEIGTPNGIYEWNHSGEFNSTFSPNKTANFSAVLNTALNSGACDCTNCSLDGANCSILFLFHSDTAGILNYSSININWEDITNSTSVFGLNPIDNYNSSNSSITFDFKAFDNINVDTIRLYESWTSSWNVNYTNSSYTNYTYINFTINNIPDGKHKYGIFSNDSENNFDWTNNRTILVDTTSPTVTNLAPVAKA